LFSLVGLIGAVRATAITYVNPAVAIVAGAVFLGEQITVWTVVGFGLVLVGSYLLTRRASPRDEVRERVPGDGAVVAIAEPLVPAGRVRST
ncbi:MAG: DMT family transporter, partial [Solirubrobacteraceae bacterium]